MDDYGLYKPGARILVVRLGAIGDCLRVCPALRRLRRSRPEATLGWAVEDRVYPLLAGHPDVDSFHVLRRSALNAGGHRAIAEILRFSRELRSASYDLVLDFHGRFKSGLVSWLSGAPLRVGYAKGDSTELNHWFMNQHVTLIDRWENRVLRFLHLLAPLGLNTAPDPGDMGIHVDASALEVATAVYEEAGRPAVALYPGCSAVRSRERWPAEKWVQLIAALEAEGISSMILWGPDEREFTWELAEACGASQRLAPATSLQEMLALTSLFRAYLGADTAAQHMCWLQGVPSAVFTGPKPPRTVAPLPHVRSRVLRVERYYREGESTRRQPLEVTTEVTVAEALEAARYLLRD